jgi:lycopene cyclase domain-containing protein
MKSAYLSVLIASVAFPLAFTLSARFGFGADWKKAWAAVSISAIPFAIWDIGFTGAGVWSFSPDFVLGPSLFGLPLEEYLFFLAIPYSCLFIYGQFRRLGVFRTGRFRRRNEERLALIWLVMALGLLLIAAMNGGRVYTVSVCLLGAAAAGGLSVSRPRFSAPLMAAVAAQSLPFLVVNGILTAMPVFNYDPGAILGVRIGTIPVEDAIYSFVMLAVPVSLFEAMASFAPAAASTRGYRRTPAAGKRHPAC